MHIIVLRDPKSGEVTKAFNVEDEDRVVSYLDEGEPNLEAYEVLTTNRNAPLTLRRVQVNEASRVTESHTISAELETI